MQTPLSRLYVATLLMLDVNAKVWDFNRTFATHTLTHQTLPTYALFQQRI